MKFGAGFVSYKDLPSYLDGVNKDTTIEMLEIIKLDDLKVFLVLFKQTA